MKKLFLIIPLGISIITMGCSNTGQEEVTTQKETIEVSESHQQQTINENVDVNRFSELVAQKEGQILDVRTPEEWNGGTIKGAIKMNFYDDNFKDQLAKLDKSKPVYVYCKSGGRSGKAAKQMGKMGFTTVYNLIGGMGAWDAARKEVVK